MFRTAFHRTVVHHASRMPGTNSFIHALRTAKITMHSGTAIFHHHLMLAIWLTFKTMMCHLANATSNEANEKDESYYNKKPGNKSKEFAGWVFFEFGKQQGACKDSK